MLVNKRPGVLLVALHAHLILLCGRLGHALLERTVRIVAVSALHQAFIHLVVEGLGEGGLHVLVALGAEGLLRGSEELWIVLRLGLVNAVAGGADNLGFGVRRTLESFMIALVAGQALLLDLVRRCAREAEEFRGVAAAVNVFLGRSVTAFARDTLTAVREDHLGMRVAAER